MLSLLATRSGRSSQRQKRRVNPQPPKESVYRKENYNISEAAKPLDKIANDIETMRKGLGQQKVENEKLDANQREQFTESMKRSEEIDAMIAKEEIRNKRAIDLEKFRKFSQSIKTRGGRRGRGNNLRKSRRRRTTRKR